jgi:hypothetical protein
MAVLMGRRLSLAAGFGLKLLHPAFWQSELLLRFIQLHRSVAAMARTAHDNLHVATLSMDQHVHPVNRVGSSVKWLS